MRRFFLSLFIFFSGVSLFGNQRLVGVYMGDMLGVNLILPTVNNVDLNVYAGFSGYYWGWGSALRTDIGLRIIHNEFKAFNDAVFPGDSTLKLYYYVIPSAMTEVYIGGGVGIGIGGEVALGLDLPIQNFDIFWDITPGVRVFPPLSPYISGGIGVRIPF